MKSGFTIITNDILNDDNLSTDEKVFIIVLKTFDHRQEGIIFPSYERIMKMSGIKSRNNISKVIKSLISKGYISKTKGGRRNYYKFSKDYLFHSCDSAGIDTGCDVKHADSTGVNGGCNTRKNSEVNADCNESQSVRAEGEYNAKQLVIAEADNSKSTNVDTDCDMKQADSYGTDKGNSIDVNTIDNGGNESNSTNGNTINSIDGGTVKKQDKKTKEIYIEILKRWNEKNINNESRLTVNLSNSMMIALRRLSPEQILSAIDRYGEIYYSGYYYDYIWALNKFLVRSNGAIRFIDGGEIWNDYLNHKQNEKRKQKHKKMNLAELID